MNGNSVGVNAQPRQSELIDEIGLLTEKINYLDALMDRLESKLSPISFAELPAVAGNNGTNKLGRGTPFGSTLQELNFKLSCRLDRLENITNRIDL